MKSRIVIAGLGETGLDLARKLALNWTVVGIDPERSEIERLRADDEAPPRHGPAPARTR